MNKIRVIDLLNKIANGEKLPKKIKWNNRTYKYVNEYKDYSYDSAYCFFEDDLLKTRKLLKHLNDEVEIIEDKIDKDIKWYFIEEQEAEKTKIAQINMNFKILREKLTEIIDKLNEMEKE